MSKPSTRMKRVDFGAIVLVFHKTNIKNGRYRFKYPAQGNEYSVLEISNCEGISLQFNSQEPMVKATEENLIFSTCYKLECRIKVPGNAQLKPTPKRMSDWPRSSEGRNYLEDVFLSQVNYFLDNLMYQSSKKNARHVNLRNVRPIGTQDIVSVTFHINGRSVASQGNPLLGRIMLNMTDDVVWPKNAHLTRSFSNVPIEHKLLTRSCALVNFGFYQESLIVAFSVLDAKVQELIKDRMESELFLKEKDTRTYLMNITQSRLDTLLNFVFKIIDKTSLDQKKEELSKALMKTNTTRNRIVHNGETATREQAVEAIVAIAKTMDFLNHYHKGQFDIPIQLLNDSERWQIL